MKKLMTRVGMYNTLNPPTIYTPIYPHLIVSGPVETISGAWISKVSLKGNCRRRGNGGARVYATLRSSWASFLCSYSQPLLRLCLFLVYAVPEIQHIVTMEATLPDSNRNDGPCAYNVTRTTTYKPRQLRLRTPAKEPVQVLYQTITPLHIHVFS